MTLGKLYRMLACQPPAVLYVMMLLPVVPAFQIQTPVPAGDVPYQHLTLEGVLVAAVLAQYRENRTKEAKIAQMSIDATVVAGKTVETITRATESIDRLASRVQEVEVILRLRN